MDGPVGRVADVERLIQVLGILRDKAGEFVPRRYLVEHIPAYAASESDDALKRMMQRDLKALREVVGFSIDDAEDPGMEARWRLAPTPWRVPLDLEPEEDAVLAALLAAVSVDASDGTTPRTPTSLGFSRSLVGTAPEPVGIIHAALASGRSLRIHRYGRESIVEPAQLLCSGGRWFLIGRFPNEGRMRVFRLNWLEVIGLGDPMASPPEPLDDPERLLDAVTWEGDPPVQIEVRCAPEDLAAVHTTFPRAAVSSIDGVAVLCQEVTNHQAVIDRVIGLGGVARLVAPPELVERLVARCRSYVEAGS